MMKLLGIYFSVNNLFFIKLKRNVSQAQVDFTYISIKNINVSRKFFAFF